MLTKEELVNLAERITSGDGFRVLLPDGDGWYITEEEVREAVETWVGPDRSAETKRVVNIIINELVDVWPLDLLDDSEEGEGYRKDMIDADGVFHSSERVEEDGVHDCQKRECIDCTEPLRVRVGSEEEARELVEMAESYDFNWDDSVPLANWDYDEDHAGVRFTGDRLGMKYCAGNIDVDFSDRKPQIEKYLEFHSEEDDMTEQTDDELTEHPDREDHDSTEREIADDDGVCGWTENENGDWETGCDFVLAGDAHYPREPNENYCQNCGNPIEIVEEGEGFEVGDVVQVVPHDKNDKFFIVSVEDNEYVFLTPKETNGAVVQGWTIESAKDEWEKVAHFQPTPEFFERVPEWVTGEIVVSHEHSDGPKITLEVTGGDPNDETILMHEDGNTEIAPEQVIDRTGIILSVSELEPIFCEEE